MEIKRIWSIYFSPVGSTAKVANETASTLRGLIGCDLYRYDFTLPQARESFPELNENDLVVFATPTYAGRVPNVLFNTLFDKERIITFFKVLREVLQGFAFIYDLL